MDKGAYILVFTLFIYLGQSSVMRDPVGHTTQKEVGVIGVGLGWANSSGVVVGPGHVTLTSVSSSHSTSYPGPDGQLVHEAGGEGNGTAVGTAQTITDGLLPAAVALDLHGSGGGNGTVTVTGTPDKKQKPNA